MAHLIEPMRGIRAGECLLELRECHKFMVEHTDACIGSLRDCDPGCWGVALKRLMVSFPTARPRLWGSDMEEHRFSEIINQCAGLERLIHAVEWALDELGDCVVEVCHPTTSSGADECDLTLCTGSNERLGFEVSDTVSTTRDNNGKVQGDIQRLTDATLSRRFLVVSSDSSRLADRIFKKQKISYRHHTYESTHIFELLVVAQPTAIFGATEA